jgi:hypothetical protein
VAEPHTKSAGAVAAGASAAGAGGGTLLVLYAIVYPPQQVAVLAPSRHSVSFGLLGGCLALASCRSSELRAMA